MGHGTFNSNKIYLLKYIYVLITYLIEYRKKVGKNNSKKGGKKDNRQRDFSGIKIEYAEIVLISFVSMVQIWGKNPSPFGELRKSN